MYVTEKFEKWGLSYSGCCGGDIGNEAQPSIWVCGIEWGTGYSEEMLSKELDRDIVNPPTGYKDWWFNLQHRFNWQAVKLLAAINGDDVSSYKQFAELHKPFCINSPGYFKANLYPIAFKNTSFALWKDQFSNLTGFDSKRDYLDWCSEYRLPKMRDWAREFKPKIIVCLGKSYFHDFAIAFTDESTQIHRETLDDRELAWGFNEDGTLVVILPFMGGSNGLVRNGTIQKFGARIAELRERKL